MALFIDQITTHGAGGTGDDTVPSGISGLDWCHLVSNASQSELETFLTTNSIAQAADVRTPALGSLQTYIGLDATQRAAAITAGAAPLPTFRLPSKSFDSPHSSAPPYWEP